MIDAHAHLWDPRFVADIASVLERATAAGVDRILSCGEDLTTSQATVRFARAHAMVRVAVGVHPHRAGSWNDAGDRELRRLAADPLVVAIGEIGMDLSGRSAPADVQERAFAAQLALAREVDLPVVVHVRDAGPLARVIVDRVPWGKSRGSASEASLRGMIHCYSEGPGEVGEWVRRGFVVSFAGTITYPKNALLREAAANAPGDRVLVETDSPYLAPQRYRGERNEPAFVAETLAAVAAARGEPADALARAMDATAGRLFGARWA